MQFEFFIGARYLRAKQKQAFISLITMLSIAGVTVGVMALIIVIAVMAGFESDLKSRILSVNSHIVVMRHGGGFTDYAKINDWVNGVKGVEASTPFILSQIMIRSASGMSGAVLRGIVPESAGRVISSIGQDDLKSLSPRTAAKPSAMDVPGVVLGKELMKNLGVVKGDTIHILSPRGMISPAGLIPVMKRFQVVGEFESGMYEYDGSLAYIHLSEAQKFLHMEDAITGIEIRVNDIYKASQISETISSSLGFPYWGRDWTQMNRNLFSALKLEKTVMFIILALIILVAAFNIASSLIMMVMEKTKDIAILKAMGATDQSIRRIFVFKGMTIGVIGTTLGVSFG
ncbi:MAG: ABC transporter permease, partial [Desulfatirhabdiaceae bacterium]|nr:ABC transporter permease [Desulfatirhabdiaceae bacterium]